MDHDLLLHTLAATLRLSTPLILCAMAGLLSERSGIVDIGLEGKMLAAAFAAASVAVVTGSPWLALAAGIVTATAFALIHGYACITQRGNQVVSGVAINLLASGLTIVLGSYWFQQGGPDADADESRPFPPHRAAGRRPAERRADPGTCLSRPRQRP